MSSMGARALGVCLGVITVCILSSPAAAATVNASSCSSTVVQAAIDAASSGDTVTVPAGICNWTTGVNIPNGKNITVQGTGIGVTTVSTAGETAVITLNNTASRITGFTFNQGQIRASGDDWRIDHNRFIGTGAFFNAIYIQCANSNPIGRHCRGLIDSNVFENGAIALPIGFNATAELHATWARPTGLGSADTVFIEDNTFSYPDDRLPHFIDTNYGGRFVFRFNTTNYEAAEIHSLQQWRGSRAWEIYKNTHNGSGWTAGLIRGGTGVVWGNAVSPGLNAYELDNLRSFLHGYNYGDCNGGSTADGNTPGQGGWPCRDQIGRGQDACLSNPSDLGASATGWCAQASEPAYFFLNRSAGVITAVSTREGQYSGPNPVRLDRDVYNETLSFTGASGVGAGPLASRPSTCTTGVAYWAIDEGSWNKLQAPNTSGQLYKCTATNTWSLYYVPYTYPHPLRGGGGGGGIPPAPTSLSVK
jgi:hypothetical protein